MKRTIIDLTCIDILKHTKAQDSTKCFTTPVYFQICRTLSNRPRECGRLIGTQIRETTQ